MIWHKKSKKKFTFPLIKESLALRLLRFASDSMHGERGAEHPGDSTSKTSGVLKFSLQIFIVFLLLDRVFCMRTYWVVVQVLIPFERVLCIEGERRVMPVDITVAATRLRTMQIVVRRRRRRHVFGQIAIRQDLGGFILQFLWLWKSLLLFFKILYHIVVDGFKDGIFESIRITLVVRSTLHCCLSWILKFDERCCKRKMNRE